MHPGLFDMPRKIAYSRLDSLRTAEATQLRQRWSELYNDFVRAVDSKLVTALVLLHLSSAFDTVDHSTLLTILDRRFGVRESVMDSDLLCQWCDVRTDTSQRPARLRARAQCSLFHKQKTSR